MFFFVLFFDAIREKFYHDIYLLVTVQQRGLSTILKL